MAGMANRLAEWLRAQLNEDERTAQAATWCGDDAATWRAAVSPYGTPSRPHGPRWYIEDSLEDGVITTVDPQASDDEGVARHIAAHDPARVLREVDAKRRIVRAYEDAVTAFENTVLGTDLHDLMAGSVNSLRYALQALALPYADRAGFKEEWRP